jgi:CHAD domain-containing protein
MHAFLEAHMGEKPALQPKAAIGPAVRAIAVAILAEARSAIIDPERSQQKAVHDFRRAMKQWRALMRLLQPFIPDATELRQQARDHARSLGRARDGQSALNAFDDLMKKTVALSMRSAATIRARIEAIRGSEEGAVLTQELRDTILAWLDATTEAVEQWPLDPFDFSSIAAQLAVGYREARRRIPDDWSQATAEDLHELRQRAVDHRYQMDLVEPLWPRHGRMWTAEA